VTASRAASTCGSGWPPGDRAPERPEVLVDGAPAAGAAQHGDAVAPARDHVDFASDLLAPADHDTAGVPPQPEDRPGRLDPCERFLEGQVGRRVEAEWFLGKQVHRSILAW
jgi:hypothetical protein